MELEGCINGLEAALAFGKRQTIKCITIFTDANYIVKYHKTAMFQWWPKNDWTRTDGSPVLNVPEWKRLLRAFQKARSQNIRVEIRKVDAHSGHVHNDAADKLAKQSANNAADRRKSVASARKKITHLKVKSGRPKPFGERLQVRIIDSLVLRQQKTIRYRYEVISETSQFHKSIDFLFHPSILEEGHSYDVTFNQEGFLQIDEVHAEIRNLKKHRLEDLQKLFHGRIIELFDLQKEVRHKRSQRFLNEIKKDGVLAAVKKSLSKPTLSPGLMDLANLGKLELSMESEILKAEWKDLFSARELKTARQKLDKAGTKA